MSVISTLFITLFRLRPLNLLAIVAPNASMPDFLPGGNHHSGSPSRARRNRSRATCPSVCEPSVPCCLAWRRHVPSRIPWADFERDTSSSRTRTKIDRSPSRNRPRRSTFVRSACRFKMSASFGLSHPFSIEKASALPWQAACSRLTT